MSWAVYQFHGSIQVVPDDDLKTHSLFHCECHPDYKDGIFIHHSFDGRELTESSLKS